MSQQSYQQGSLFLSFAGLKQLERGKVETAQKISRQTANKAWKGNKDKI